jgi:hypothetical protein
VARLIALKSRDEFERIQQFGNAIWTTDERGSRQALAWSRTWILSSARRLRCTKPIVTEIGLFEAIYSARALRRLKPDPVLDAAIRAPTSPNYPVATLAA